MPKFQDLVLFITVGSKMEQEYKINKSKLLSYNAGLKLY